MAAPAACDALPPPVIPPPLPLGVTIPVATRSFDLLSPPTSTTVAPDATIPISQLDSAAEASACFGGFDGAEATIVEPPVQFVSSNVETSVAMLDAVNVDGAEATTVWSRPYRLRLLLWRRAAPRLASPRVWRWAPMTRMCCGCMMIVRQRCGAARRTR